MNGPLVFRWILGIIQKRISFMHFKRLVIIDFYLDFVWNKLVEQRAEHFKYLYNMK